MELKIIKPGVAKAILADEELFNRVAEYGAEFSSIKISECNVYVGIYVDNEIIGFWCIEPENKTTVEIHCNIVKKHRSHGVEAGHKILAFIKSQPFSALNVHKINCKIPVCYPDVYHFTKKFGFMDEGVDRQSIKKNGELYDRNLLGLLVGDIKDGFC